MTLWVLLIGMGLMTYATRLSMIALVSRLDLPGSAARILRLLPAAVLSAIILPALVRPAGPVELTLTNTRLLAGAVATVIALRTGNALLVIAGGMITLWLLNALR